MVLEVPLKQNLMVIDDFIFKLIRRKREQMRNEKLDVITYLALTIYNFLASVIIDIFMSAEWERQFTVKVFDGKCKGSREYN